LPKSQTSMEKREFFRLDYEKPLKFKSAKSDETIKAKSQNISASGILFSTQKNPPKLSSILWMDLDIRTLKICQEIENRALMVNNGLVGRVVRVEEEGGTYNVGVCFLTQPAGISSRLSFYC
jgi:c-di-GMP-binding flagellar brake protein YcgR